MKTLIISDTHLTHKFDQKKFNYLKQLFQQYDKIIFNGDFWDVHMTTFDKFINSKWKELFPIMKEKNTVYIYGNHDEQGDNDERVNLFSTEQSYAYRLKVGKKVLYITHGQKVVEHINFVHRLVDKHDILKPPVRLVLNILVAILGKKYFGIYRAMNEDMKTWAKKNLADNEILVCGHSHLNEVDIKNKFIDLGCNRHGMMQYMVVEGDKFGMVF